MHGKLTSNLSRGGSNAPGKQKSPSCLPEEEVKIGQVHVKDWKSTRREPAHPARPCPKAEPVRSPGTLSGRANSLIKSYYRASLSLANLSPWLLPGTVNSYLGWVRWVGVWLNAGSRPGEYTRQGKAPTSCAAQTQTPGTASCCRDDTALPRLQCTCSPNDGRTVCGI